VRQHGRVLVWLLLVILVVACKRQETPAPAERTVLMDQNERSKLGPQLRKLVRNGEENREVEVFILCRSEVDDSLRAALIRAGVRPGSVVRRRLTGRVSVRALKQLADFAEIEYIEQASRTRPAQK